MRVALVGSGGHAKVVLATLREAGFEVSRVVDDDESRWGRDLMGITVHGPSNLVLDDPSQVAILAIGHNEHRRTMAEKARCRFAEVIHPRAYVHDSVVIDPGTVVFAGAIVQPGARIGAHTIVNTSASIDHDCVLGDYVHVAPGAHMSGASILSDGVFLGIGASVIQEVQVGAWTQVGAGAAVVADLPPGVLAVGVPAKVVRALGNT